MSLFGVPSDPLSGALSDLLFGLPSEPPTFWRRFRRRFQEALVQSHVRFNRFRRRLRSKSQVRFNRVPEKVPEKVWEALVQSQVRFNRSGEGLGGFGAARSGSTGFRRRFRRRFQEALVQSQVKFNGSGEGCRSQARSGSFNSRKPSWGVSRPLLRSTLQKDL